jgi:hypothetical protein
MVRQSIKNNNKLLQKIFYAKTSEALVLSTKTYAMTEFQLVKNSIENTIQVVVASF